MLGAAGAAIQALFANPLASPDLTGTTSGAALGAVVAAYLLGLSSPFGLAIGAVAGSQLAARGRHAWLQQDAERALRNAADDADDPRPRRDDLA